MNNPLPLQADQCVRRDVSPDHTAIVVLLDIAGCQVDLCAVLNPGEQLMTGEPQATIARHERDEVLANELSPVVVIMRWTFDGW